MGRTASLRSQETLSTVPMPSDRSIAEPLTQMSQINTSPNNAANNGISEHEDTFADQAEHTQPDPEMEVQSHLDSTGVWLLAAQHLSSTWGDRTAEFAFPLYLIELFVNTLLPASIYGFVITGAGILLSGSVGSMIDKLTRLKAVRISILTQKLSASISYALFIILFSKFPNINISDARAMWLIFAAITANGCILKLATVGMNVCIERDWVMTIAASNDRSLLRLNTIMRRIDLLCKLLAPLFVSLLTSTIGYPLSAIVLLAIGALTMAFEFLFVKIVYRKFSVLGSPRLSRRIPETSESEDLATTQSETKPLDWRRWAAISQAWLGQQLQDWKEFVHHPIFISSLSISLLYLTVLSFDSTFLAYLKSQTDYSDPFIAGMRGLCVVTGLIGTFAMPWLEKSLGLVRAGSWSLWSQVLSLIPAALSFYIGAHGQDRAAWNSVMLFGGLALSRIGLWSFDLVQLTQLQKALANHPRQNTLTALQFSLQNIFDLVHYGLTLGWNKPDQFKFAATVSMASVFMAAVVYVWGYARPLRGHVFHTGKVVSRLSVLVRRVR